MADVIEAITKGLVKAPAAAEALAAAAACGGGAGGGPLQALGRLFFVCASGRCEQQSHHVLENEVLVLAAPRPVVDPEVDVELLACRAAGHASAVESPDVGGSDLVDLATQGPYLLVASCLDAATLCCADAACRPLRDLHRGNGGAWRGLGASAFLGLELESEGMFLPVEPGLPAKVNRIDWKGRYARFLAEICAFREPFGSTEITQVDQADEIAYGRCRLCTDVLSAEPSRGVYIEVEVLSNPDNVSLAVVNFDAGGCSSVTFSPDTGAVIRERKVCEEPRKVQGAYIQPLTTITHGQGFEGSMGLYLHGGQLAFFRRHLVAGADGEEPELGPWESTGFITDLAWAEGKQLTPCLAFRDEGGYRVRTSRVGSEPPLLPERATMAYSESSWSDLNWDADQELAEI